MTVFPASRRSGAFLVAGLLACAAWPAAGADRAAIERVVAARHAASVQGLRDWAAGQASVAIAPITAGMEAR